jgi:TolB-like protein/DNA-binding winged helix-turn-helix (wHTH) protein/Tfp pilus assembly protein PilF
MQQPEESRLPRERAFQLRQWRVEPGRNRIVGPDGEVRLRPRTMDVLVLLAERSGEVVSRDDFAETLWQSSVVTEDSLTRIISELRKILGDRTDEPAFIETIPKRGYRLAAPVQWEVPTEADPHEHVVDGERQNGRGSISGSLMRHWQPLAWLLLITAVAAMTFALHRASQPDPALERFIAVLPFETFGVEDDRSFIDGLHHDLLTRLSNIADLRVISRTSVRPYKDTLLPIPEIARELGVSWVLEGAVQQHGNEFQLNAQLIEAQSDTHVWARTYRRELTAENLFAIQADIVEDIAASMKSQLTSDEERRIETIPTRSTQAYAFYLQAREYATRDWHVEEDLDIAVQLYEQAIEQDPNFSLAYAGLSRTHMTIYWHKFDPSQERLEQGRRSLEMALAIDPDHPKVRLAEGIYHYWRFRDYERALESLRASRQIVPNDAEVHQFIGAIHRRLGNWDRALTSFQRAHELDPRNIQLMYGLVRTHLAVRDHDSAERVLDDAEMLFPDAQSAQVWRIKLALRRSGNADDEIEVARTRWPDFFLEDADRWLLLYLARDFEYMLDRQADFPGDAVDMQRHYYPKSLLIGLVHHALGNRDPAREHAETAREMLVRMRENDPEDPRIRGALGKAYALLGMEGEAIDEGRAAISLLPISQDAHRGPSHEVRMARIEAILGHHDQALARIRQVLSQPFDEMTPGLLKTDPAWDGLRQYQEFQSLLVAPAQGY